MWDVIVDALKSLIAFLWGSFVALGHSLIELLFAGLGTVIPASNMDAFFAILAGANNFLPVEPLRDGIAGVLAVWGSVEVVRWLLKILRGA